MCECRIISMFVDCNDIIEWHAAITIYPTLTVSRLCFFVLLFFFILFYFLFLFYCVSFRCCCCTRILAIFSFCVAVLLSFSLLPISAIPHFHSLCTFVPCCDPLSRARLQLNLVAVIYGFPEVVFLYLVDISVIVGCCCCSPEPENTYCELAVMLISSSTLLVHHIQRFAITQKIKNKKKALPMNTNGNVDLLSHHIRHYICANIVLFSLSLNVSLA